MAEPATIKTNNEFFTGIGPGNKIFRYRTPHLIVNIVGTVNIGVDGINFMPLVAGNHTLSFVNAKTVYFSGTGTWTGWGLS